MGANFWNAGYIYRFSKRTEGFLYYYKVDNKESGTYSSSVFIVGAPAPGADTTGYGAGIQHFF
jgi:predicted porin